MTPEARERLFWSRIDKSGGEESCWPWTAPVDKDGYGRFGGKNHVGVGGSRVVNFRKRSHVFAWELLHGPVPNGLSVLHNCPGNDNPACCNPAHLWVGTQAQNMADKVAKGRQARGVKNARASIDEEKVRLIRRLARSHANCEIAQRLGITKAVVFDVVNRRTWKHVADEAPAIDFDDL